MSDHYDSGKRVGNVLIVDDEPDMRELMVELLSIDFQCEVAATGREAVAKMSKQKFDAILTDFDMPDINGFELIKVMHETAREIPIVIVTGYGSQDLMKRTVAFNVFDFLEKPVKPKVLVQTLRACIESNWKPLTGRNSANAISKHLYRDFDVRISHEAADNLKQFAEEQGISISSAIERLILEKKAS